MEGGQLPIIPSSHYDRTILPDLQLQFSERYGNILVLEAHSPLNNMEHL